jgi:uncharacterized damage-inducible protein DinB
MIDIDRIQTDLDESTDALLQQLAVFDGDKFKTSPADGQWSPAQVAEHLLILDIIANKVLSGETMQSTRPPDSKIDLIRTAMDDVSTPRTAPDHVVPGVVDKDYSQFAASFEHQRRALKEKIKTLDLTEACKAHKHPSLGTLTRLEWLYFTIFHTKRHTGQIARLAAMA